MPLALVYPANTLSGAYSIDNSCRFNTPDSSYVHKTQGTSTDTDKYTLSVWLKRGSNLGAVNTWFSEGTGLTAQADYNFKADGTMMLYNRDASSNIFQLVTNRKFFDVAAWYHVVLLFDSSQATDTNRMKLYINGVQETSFSTATYPAQDLNSEVNKGGTKHTWAAFDSNGSIVNEFDGYIAEALFLDGTVAAIGDLGEFSETSPTIWKPKDVSSLTFGTNGYYLDFEDSSNLGNDANGGTDLTEVNLAAADQSVDTPTNNACTLNSLAVATSSALAFSEGNNKIYNSASSWRPAYGTFPVSTGKWYFEAKGLLFPGTSYIQIGWVSLEYTGGGNAALTDEIAGWGNTAPAAIYDSRAGNVYWQNASTNGNSSYGDSYAAGDVIGVAIDLDNSKIYFAEDNTWKNSGDPTSGATGTGAFSIVSGYTWAPFIGLNNATAEATFASPVQANTSDAQDGNGYGQFEFAPPSGYLSICSKNTA